MKVYLCILPNGVETDDQLERERCRNELLDVYSLYMKTGIQSIKEEVIYKAFELHLQDPAFSFIL